MESSWHEGKIARNGPVELLENKGEEGVKFFTIKISDQVKEREEMR